VGGAEDAAAQALLERLTLEGEPVRRGDLDAPREAVEAAARA
jgi:hypothetical protein